MKTPFYLISIFSIVIILSSFYYWEKNTEVLLKFSFVNNLKEDRVENFAVLYERPTQTDINGYFPRNFLRKGKVFDVPTTYEQTVSFHWKFGDDTEVISSGEHPQAQHIFRKPGKHEVSVSMYVEDKEIKTIRKEFTVDNMPVKIRDLTAIRTSEIDTFEFAARTIHALNEDLTFEWDFGDGEKETTNKPEVKHRFKIAGTFPVKLLVRDAATDDEDEEEITVAVYAKPEELEAPKSSDPGEVPLATAASTRLDAKLSGSINGEMKGEIRPFAGIYLGPSKNGCRFMMNAWDRQNLSMLTLIADVSQFTPQAHRFEVAPATAQFVAFGKSEDFINSYSSRGNDLLPVNATVFGDSLAIIHAGSREEQPYAKGPIAQRSSFGLDENIEVEYRSGNVTLDIKAYDRIEAKMNLFLANDEGDNVNINGTFMLDLQSAVRDAIVLYDCNENIKPFEVKRVRPNGDLKLSDYQPIEIQFSEEYDYSSATISNIQVGYPDNNGEFIRVSGRLMKDPKRIFFVPEKPWKSGVRHTLKIRANSKGLRSTAGQILEGSSSEGWYERNIWAELDFTLVNGGNLGAHVFQSVRDAPLIKGKPIMWRIYASWPRFDDVARYAQTESFTARVTGAFGYDHIKASQTFVRPDLWVERGVNKANADHTANVFGFTPTEESGFYLYQFKIERFENGTWVSRHRVTCPGRYWKHSPTLKIDWYIGPVESFAEGGHEDMVVYGERIMRRAAHRIWQQYPFAKVIVEYRDVAPMLKNPSEGVECEELNYMCAIKNLAFPPDPIEGHLAPDMIVLFLPNDGGGTSLMVKTDSTKSRLINDKKYVQIANPDYLGGIVTARLNKEEIMEDWNTTVITHEVGHALRLPHKPALNEPDNASAVKSMRSDRDRQKTFSHLGIEGFALSEDGLSGFNKSSTEGNGEDRSLTTIMFPLVLHPAQMYITPDHYRKVMKTIENSPGLLD